MMTKSSEEEGVEKFRYLVIKERDDPAPALFSVYSRAKVVKNKWIILWNEENKHFYLFRSPRAMWKFLEDRKAGGKELHFYEVILSEVPQKCKIDIDGGDARVAESLRRELKKISGYPVIVTDSSSGTKFSRHLIVDHFYADAWAAKQVMDDLAALTDSPYIDQSVYKDIQYFRLTGSSKIGGVTKRILTRGYRPQDTLIGKYLSK